MRGWLIFLKRNEAQQPNLENLKFFCKSHQVIFVINIKKLVPIIVSLFRLY